jgi:outer membrane protein
MTKKIVLLALATLCLYAKPLSLNEAISIALENNRHLKISKLAVDIAEAQYQQALSARYPQLTATVQATRMDEAPLFEMAGNVALPPQLSGALYAMTGTPMPSLPVSLDTKITGRDVMSSSLNVVYPLYTGGKIDALIKQANLNKTLQNEEARRSELEVIYDVKRYYYGAMLTQKLYQEATKTLMRMQMVRDLTEAFYNGGSLKVKKTDFLRTTNTVGLIESLSEEMRANVELSKSALLNTMGLAWNTPIEIGESEFKTPKMMTPALASLIEESYRYNPNYAQLKLAIDIHDAKIDEAKSDYMPSIALLASAKRFDSDLDGGLINDATKNTWTIGVGFQWKLFEGFRTDNAVEEARLNKLTFEHKEVLLKEGLALQVKHAFIKMGQNKNQFDALERAKNASVENADLNIRAYQADMVETKDVIEAQIMDSITKLSYYRNLHDFALAQSQLEFIVAHEITQ